MSKTLNQKLFEMRNELFAQIANQPGVFSVGLTKKQGIPRFIVSVDQEKYTGEVPPVFHGYEVEVRDFGHPVAHGFDFGVKISLS